ncbi:hypothetical protein [Rhodococcus sp. BS-15]|uniref:hypothetical protein n=1 Tax=Rhodococcus sp. BS-15 TaxID=1304954 RepID=UPI000ADF7154|nr:hypothetical protein [Rhodococcus sp. BS-15]
MQRPVVHWEPTEPGSRVLGAELTFDQQGGAFYIGLWTRQILVLWTRRVPTPMPIAHDCGPAEGHSRKKVGL